MKLRNILVFLLLTLILSTPALAAGVKQIGIKELHTLTEASKGKVLIINYWATWCAPCVQEFPGIVALRNQFPEKDLTIIGISVDNNVRPVENFIAQHKVNFPIYLDNREISTMLSISSIPRTVIYDRSGKKVLDHLGIISEDSVRHLVQELL